MKFTNTNYYLYLISGAAFFILCLLLLVCLVIFKIPTEDERKEYILQQEKTQLLNRPIKIAEHDGIILWKVEDVTPGGRRHVYYTSNGQVIENQK